MREQINKYIQDLLKLQFIAAECIEHRPTKGQLRERFVKQVIQNEFPNIILKSGILYMDNWQSTQGDILWLRENARIGTMDMYELDDCVMFLEIKSRAKANELSQINETARILKEKHTDCYPVIVGMMCYCTEAQEKTVLRKMGFSYDKELDSYEEYQVQFDQLKNIDFLFSLNMNKDQSIQGESYLVTRDRTGSCVLWRSNPVIQYFFNYFKRE